MSRVHKITDDTFRYNGSVEVVNMGDEIYTNCGLDTIEVSLADITELLEGGMWVYDDSEYVHLIRLDKKSRESFKALRWISMALLDEE